MISYFNFYFYFTSIVPLFKYTFDFDYFDSTVNDSITIYSFDSSGCSISTSPIIDSCKASPTSNISTIIDSSSSNLSFYSSFNYSFDHYVISSINSSYYSYLIDFNRLLIIPLYYSFKFNIFSFDVIHSFGLLSYGIKIDGIPGRFNISSLLLSSFIGSHSGFCYELCGQGHSLMLIQSFSL